MKNTEVIEKQEMPEERACNVCGAEMSNYLDEALGIFCDSNIYRLVVADRSYCPKCESKRA